MRSLKAFLFTLFILSSVFATDYPSDDNRGLKIFSDSEIKKPSYKSIVKHLKRLEKNYPSLAKLIPYGTTIGKRPLLLIKISHPKAKNEINKAIYIGGSTHGDEYLNIEDRLPEWFLKEAEAGKEVATFLNKGGVVYLVPIVNPDGFETHSRDNLNHVDLNRDYTVRKANIKGFTQVETKSLVDYLIKDLAASSKKLAVAMDFHCCYGESSGALLHPWSFEGPVLSTKDKAQFSEIIDIMDLTLGGEIYSGTGPDLLGYDAKGTSKDFYWESFGALAFTYEGRRRIEHKYFKDHQKMWKEIVKLLTSQK